MDVTKIRNKKRVTLSYKHNYKRKTWEVERAKEMAE